MDSQPTTRILLAGLLLACTFLSGKLMAQQEIDTTNCDPNANFEISSGEVNFNYGATTNAFGFTSRSNVIVGQPFTGKVVGRENISEYGFYARLFLPPQPSSVKATQGDFPNRIQLEWTPDPLSSEPSDGFIIRRDGAYLGQVDLQTREYIDFNVQAGEFYEYEVVGRNQFGNGSPGRDVGFVNPNGVVLGSIETFSGNPVTNATVTLSPTIGNSLAFDGVDDFLCVSYNTNAMPTDSWTTSFWVKLDSSRNEDPILDLGSDFNYNFWFNTYYDGADKGVNVNIGDGTTSKRVTAIFDEDANGWHQVAAVYSGGRVLLYLDGMFEGSMMADIDVRPRHFFVGTNQEQSAYFGGKLDELRIYSAPLTQTQIIQTKDITVSSRAPNIVAYWKADEGLGRKVFDLTDNDIDGELFGPAFSDDTPEVLNAGMTDESGIYTIEGINYSQEQTFEAQPSKNFYYHQSLEFNAAFGAYAQLDSFDLSDTATIEIAVQPFDLEMRQTILAQGSSFELFIENSTYKLTVNGTTQDLGPATSEYTYLAIQLEAATGNVYYYRNGSLANTLSGYSLSGDYGTSPWFLATKPDQSNHYTGLIDMVAVFDTIYGLDRLELHASPLAGENITSGVDAGDANLRVYYPLDEGRGTIIDDYGPNMLDPGSVHNATFSIIAYRQRIEPHVFRPSSRVVNLNASATSVNNVDFKDESTITISGVVRYDGYFCYQDSVELLVNGFPYFPVIYTDSDGRFNADFEPGMNVRLTPRFRDSTHFYSPGFFEVRNLNRPIAGIGFLNTTKREIRGQLAGGKCRLPINELSAPARIKIATLNGCYETEITIDNEEGLYHVTDLPPEQYTVSVVYHPASNIYDAFQIAGGQEIDLRAMESDTVDFIFTAPPEIDLQPFDTLANCPGVPAFIEQSTAKNGFSTYRLDVRAFETYGDERCYLDSFDLTINNDVWGTGETQVTVQDTTVYVLETLASEPNLNGDRTRFIQVTAETATGSATDIERVIVLGERSREATFTTASPAFPMIILRDPPGDGSSATYESGNSQCVTIGNGKLLDASGSLEVKIDLGAKTQVVAAPFGVGKIIESEIINNRTIKGYINEASSNESSSEVCFTTTETYSTSEDDAVVGPDADLFVGAAINWGFSATDILEFDYQTCMFKDSVGFKVSPEGFGTTYIYSAWQLKTDVIPSLEALGRDADARAWRRLLEQNEQMKTSAVFDRNISFDALNTYTESMLTETTESNSYSYEFNWGIEQNQAFGAEIFGIGTTVTLETDVGTTNVENRDTTITSSTEVSYTLADDDPNDNWTIDILKDGRFQTPVFRVIAGETMCPWEPGTLNREQVGFSVDRIQAINVPANDPAVFNLQLTNDSQTGNDPLIYILGTVEGSNPNGAIIAVDGEGLVEPRPFQILPGETLNVLLTVERGPLEYSYSDLGIFMASECMWEHSRGLGYDLSDHTVAYDDFGEVIRQGIYNPADLAKFYKEFRVGVEYLEPCTPIDIGFPMQDWVVTPNDNNRLGITLNDYIYDDPDLETVRVQYRRTGGDGAWINLSELPASEFANDPVFKIVNWDMNDLVDGPYDIRAVAECSDLSLNPGISTIVQGRKETQPPALFGTPEPADGVLSPGDEISITFTKRIRCDQIFQADGIGTNINLNNLALIDVATGTLIDATIACREDKIVITPNIANQFIENRTLRVVTNDISDLYGNTTDEIAWEFFVNRSNLYWDGGGINEMTPEGEQLIVTREIRNQGGAITSYTIDDVPSWMTVFPRAGSLEPGTRQIVTFEFPASLPSDAYNTQLIMGTVDGPEPLDIDLRVTCPAPPWAFDPAQYTFSMSLTVELDIEGTLSNDRVDQVAAFIDGELRGLANIEYVDILDQNGLNSHLAFLTVYSNAVSGETIEFQIWDASACLLYGNTLESFSFVPDGIIGAPLEPQTIHTSGQVLKKIYLRPGWNWISYNLNLNDPSINSFLQTLTNPGLGMIIKDQTTFSQFTPGPNLWLGSLLTTNTETMYQIRSNTHDSLTLIGSQVDPTTPIPVTSGWNWIGYLPSQSLTVNEALSGLNLFNGDIVKSQFAFAQYVAGAGWIGNLDFMSSPEGYLLRLSAPQNLVYPDTRNFDGTPESSRSGATGRFQSPNSYWNVTPENFEHSMNMIVVVHDSLNQNVLEVGDEIGVLAGEEIRGANQVLYVPELEAHLVFLTIYANVDGEPLEFKFYDSSTGEVHDLVDTYNFVINQVVGMANDPQPLHLNDVLNSINAPLASEQEYFKLFPNPAGKGQEVYLNFSADIDETLDVIITDAFGRQVDQLRFQAPQRDNVVEWRPKNLPAGLYFVNLRRKNTLTTLRLNINKQ